MWRQRELLTQRGSTTVLGSSALGFALALLLLMLLNGIGALAVRQAVRTGGQFEAQRAGRILVDQDFLDALKSGEADTSPQDRNGRRTRRSPFAREARSLTDTPEAADREEQRLRDVARTRGIDGFVSDSDSSTNLATIARAAGSPALLGSLVLLFWGAMLVLSGEGLAFDIQRKRHPIWEWQFSHPVPMAAVFLAEMISPLVANPCT